MVSHDPLAPQSTHVANTPDFEDEEVIMQGGRLEGEKDLVKLVGRKRRLPVEDDEEDTDYLPPAKRPEYAVEDADKQSAGCTDEWMVPSPTLLDEESSSDDSESESEEDEQVETEEIFVPYPPPRTWVAKVEWALARLGGKGTLADIYSAIEEVFPEDVDGKRNWKAAIRSCLSKNEKRKFLKPSTSLASKDHLWCLVPRDSSRAPPKRGRPAGRRRVVTPKPALRRDTAAPALQEREQLLPELLTVDTAPAPISLYETELEKDQKIASLLRQKQLLEDDINRLLQEQQESGEGLSPDQEDWLSHLLA